MVDWVLVGEQRRPAERLGWGFLEGYLEGVVLVLDNIEFKVGKGTKVSFWTDHWCGNEELAQTFPQLFELAVQRNASVNEMWDSSLGQGGWNIRLSRNLNDWELDALGELLQLLRDLRTSLEEDAVIWKGESHGLFRIKDAYSFWQGLMSLASRKRAFGWISCKGSLGDCLGLVWANWVFPKKVKDMLVSWRALLWEKEEKDLDFHSAVYFLDGLEGEK
ncbi:hypothetical protein CK203_107250 [Vitis vinifera]|uniref:Uncharacterized protein n=1 Tax=Vitis vinifera TaxID=29760 RepID=A0A438BNA4_VITVI|nr:hypothetical protein CK203_107250 [Vitis vinifera]